MIHSVVVLVAAHLTQSPAMPLLNIEPSCHAAANMDLADSQSFVACMRDETEAKNQVANNWDRYTPAARQRCSEETRIEGNPSYV
jgi:hypothetical protein